MAVRSFRNRRWRRLREHLQARPLNAHSLVLHLLTCRLEISVVIWVEVLPLLLLLQHGLLLVFEALHR